MPGSLGIAAARPAMARTGEKHEENDAEPHRSGYEPTSFSRPADVPTPKTVTEVKRVPFGV